MRLVLAGGLAIGVAACGLLGEDPALSGPGTGAMGDDFDGVAADEAGKPAVKKSPGSESEAPEDVDIDLGSPVKD
ncbi:MAG: hypothetical protein CMM50_01265 [Rhodospirillaceae bacterium]|nr:hypothetical protein [Rhodospirillaceae bacterium]